MQALFELKNHLKLLLPLAALLAAGVFGVTELAYQNSTGALASLASRGVARSAINTVLTRLLDAETAQRGYLLTGRAEYLEQNKNVPHDINAAIATLLRHYKGNDRLVGVARELGVHAAERQSEVDATIRLYNEGQHERALDLILTNIGKEKMDAVRMASNVLMAAEDASVQAERSDIVSTLRYSRAGVHLLTALSLLALVFYVRKTAALEAARLRHAQDLQTERTELERQVRVRTAELTRLTAHLLTAREDERGHLARELHDELGALLTAAKLDVARLKRAMGSMAPVVEERLRHLNISIDQGIALKRRIIEDLRPSSLSNLGLCAALEIQAREFGARSGVALHMQLEQVELPPDAELIVYRVVQESFTNVAKYAAASEVTVTLQSEAGRVRLAIEDNGKGFDAARVASTAHGLTGMRYRVEAASGVLHVVSAPGRGTMIEVWLPALAPSEASA